MPKIKTVHGTENRKVVSEKEWVSARKKLLLKEKKWPVPGFIEYEYKGAGTSQEEVKKCYDYIKQVLET